jgi:serine/threonine protein kinase/WD40 repeat protein
MNQKRPEKPDSKDRMAQVAESFDSQLRQHGEAVWPDELEGDRIPAVLALINATLQPGSTCSVGPEDTPDISFVVPRQIGRFKVGPEVGRGGFGVVYRAHDELLHRVVAIKAIPRRAGLHHSSDDVRLREARAVARLNHPNLVPLYEVLDDENCVYLISEFCEGPTLSTYLRELHCPLNPRWAGEITLRIAQAISHAHDRGLVHRDIKPSNVLLMTERIDADVLPFTPRLTDFGLVIETGTTGPASFSNRLVGTVNFMSPEQILGDERWDARLSDIYSLGLLLYRMLAGRSPYHATSPIELVEEICSRTVADLPKLSPPIPADLAAICSKAIQKEPTERYATARDLVDDLLRWREGRAVSARKQSIPERVRRTIRREPVVASLGVAFVLLSIVSSISFASSNQRLRKQGVALQQAFKLASTNESKAIQAAYFSDISQAYLALAKNDSSTALSTLTQIESYIGDEQRERFDLRLLRSLSQQGWSQVASLEGVVEEIVYVPSKGCFAVVGETEGVHFIRESDGTVIGRYGVKAPEKIKALALTLDGTCMSIGKSTAPTLPWGLAEGGQAVELVSLDNLWARTADSEKSAEADCRTLHTWSGFDATVESLAFSDDGKHLAVGPRYEPIQVLSVLTDAPRLELWSDRRNEDLSFSRRSELTWMTTKTSVSVYDLRKKKQVRQSSLPAPHEARRVRRSPDGKWLVAAPQKVAQAFLFATGVQTDQNDTPIVLDGVAGELMALSFSPNSKYLAVGSIGGCVSVWDLDVLDTRLRERRAGVTATDMLESMSVSAERVYRVHHTPVTSLAVSDHGTVLSGDAKGAVVLIHGDSPAAVDRRLALPCHVRTACVASDGGTVFVGGEDGSIWSINTNTNESTKLHDGYPSAVTRLGLSQDNRWLAAGFFDGQVVIRENIASSQWNLVPYVPIDTQPMMAIVRGIEFNSSAQGMLITRGYAQAQWVDLEFPETTAETVRIKERYVYHAPTPINIHSIIDDDTVLAFGDTYCLLEGDTEVQAKTMVGSHHVCSACFDPASQNTILGTHDGYLRVVDQDGKMLRESQRWKPLESGAREVRQINVIALSPNGENIFTGSKLGDVGIWDAKALRYLGTIPRSKDKGAIDMISVSKDGKWLVTHQYGDGVNQELGTGEIRVISIR